MPTEQSSEEYVYDHIPTLKELLPASGGRPGVQYAQVTSERLWLAQKSEFRKVSGAQMMYTIRGPKGEVHCELYGEGRPIKGQGSKSGKRICWLDTLIREKTGLLRPNEKPPIEVAPRLVPTEEKPKGGGTQKSVKDSA